jgi:hypothetical protein
MAEGRMCPRLVTWNDMTLSLHQPTKYQNPQRNLLETSTAWEVKSSPASMSRKETSMSIFASQPATAINYECNRKRPTNLPSTRGIHPHHSQLR